MRFRCAAAGRAAFVAAMVGLVFVALRGASSPVRAAGTREIPQHLRDRAHENGRVRVILELQLPSPHVPEGTLKSAPDVSTQRQLIAAQGARVFSRLPTAAYRILHQYRTVPYVALELTPAA